MKIWLVYQVGEPGKKPGSPPFVFGYILKKEVKDAFIEERNMDYFVIKEKKLKKEDVLAIMESMRWKKLDFTDFKTRDDNSVSGFGVIRLVATEGEALHIYTIDDQVFNYMGKLTEPYMLNAKGKYRQALSGICYYSIYHWYGKSNQYYDIDDWRGLPADSLFMDKKVKIDEFEAYVHFHGKTLKLGRRKND